MTKSNAVYEALLKTALTERVLGKSSSVKLGITEHECRVIDNALESVTRLSEGVKRGDELSELVKLAVQKRRASEALKLTFGVHLPV